MSKKQKAWLEQALKGGILDEEAELFVAINHRSIMTEHSILPGQFYRSMESKFRHHPTKPNAIAAAKEGLGQNFYRECERFKKLLKTDPSSIDKKMIEEVTVNFVQYTPPEIDELTRRYLVNVGKEPTKELMVQVRPAIIRKLERTPTLSGKIAAIDTQLFKLS